MKTYIKLIFYIVSIFSLFFQLGLQAQIDDIKKKSDDNKNSRRNNNSSGDNDSNGSIGESCTSDCVSSCTDFGCSILGSLVGEYTSDVYRFKSTNPSILSLDVDAGFAPAYHQGVDKGYKYMIYLPAIRANLAAFMLDLRFNLLTEFTNNMPNSFKNIDMIAGFNIVPNDAFVLTLGAGAQREIQNNMYFTEFYIGSKIGLSQNKNYLDLSFRMSDDFETQILPFQEAAIKYNIKIVDMGKIYVHLTLGGMYQNYYQSHDIWAFRTGIVLNVH